GKWIASASADQTVRLWDVRTGEPGRLLTGHQTEVRSVSFSPDGQRVISGDEKGQLIIWDPATGAVLSRHQGHAGEVLSVTFHPNGRGSATAGGDLKVQIWDALTGHAVRPLEGHHCWVHGAAFSPGWTHLVGELPAPEPSDQPLTRTPLASGSG